MIEELFCARSLREETAVAPVLAASFLALGRSAGKREGDKRGRTEEGGGLPINLIPVGAVDQLTDAGTTQEPTYGAMLACIPRLSPVLASNKASKQIPNPFPSPVPRVLPTLQGSTITLYDWFWQPYPPLRVQIERPPLSRESNTAVVVFFIRECYVRL